MKKTDEITPNKTAPVAGTHADSDIPPEVRHNMIATTAYYLAECRGFSDGCELEDWLAAEAEIEHRLKQD